MNEHSVHADANVSQFYIPAASSLAERRLRALKHDDTFALFDQYGDIIPFPNAPDGLYSRDTRYLSHLELRLNGQRPLLLSSTIRDDNAVLAVDLTNPDIYIDGELVLPREALHVQRLRFLWQATCHERLSIRNFDASPKAIAVSLQFAADFADLFEVRGQSRIRRGKMQRTLLSDHEVSLRYMGLDDLARTTSVRFTPPPDKLDVSTASYDLILEPNQRVRIFSEIACTSGSRNGAMPKKTFAGCMFAARRGLRQGQARATQIQSSNSQLNQLLDRSVSDLYMLVSETTHGPYPYAGIPWFSTPFGRDGLITALFTLWLDPKIAYGVLNYLAATQATEFDPERDAEPGKILHETRAGEMARLREVPFGAYYGSVDATPLFVVLAGAYVERTGDKATLQHLWPHVSAALNWIDLYGDRDADGFVEYDRRSDDGLVNQGWKDSHDSMFHADGRLANGPIALCEVQAYVYLAKRYAAAMARLLELPDQARVLDLQAEQLKKNFSAAFWCEELSTFALALDGDKEPLRVCTSNAGHALFAGIATPEQSQSMAKVLLGSDSYAGWGIRTVAASQARYNPMSYHNGSVWPHDNAIIALGLDRYGHKVEVSRLYSGMFDASIHMDLRRLPELFCGFSRQPHSGPTLYPVACTPQAWATATPFAMMQALLGISLDFASSEIRFRRPRLPESLAEVKLSGLRLGDQSADILIRRSGTSAAVHTLDRTERLRVVVHD